MKQLHIFFFALMFFFKGFGQEYISREKAIADIDFFNQTLQEVHYNPYLFVQKPDYFSAVVKLKEQLPDSVKRKDFIISLYQLSSLLADSHTNPGIQQPVLGAELKSKGFFPYRVLLKNHKAYLPVQLGFDKAFGAEIISINKRPIAPLLKEFQTYYGGRAEYKTEMAQRLFAYFLMLHDIKPPFFVQYKDASEKTETITVEEGINFIETIALTMPGLLEGNYFEVKDSIGIVHFRNMFGNWEEWSELLDKAFTEFEAQGIGNVVIDMRENAGGNSLLGEVLFGFITEKPFLFQHKREWKISQQYKDYLIKNGNTEHEYLSKQNGTVWERAACNPQPSRMQVEKKFMGNIYMLIGPFTFSSGNMVADAAKYYDIATLLGAPTGENTVDFGEVLPITLPNSGVVMTITTAMDYGANCNEIGHSPVIPDEQVQNTLEESLKGTDSAMEFIKKKVAEN